MNPICKKCNCIVDFLNSDSLCKICSRVGKTSLEDFGHDVNNPEDWIWPMPTMENVLKAGYVAEHYDHVKAERETFLKRFAEDEVFRKRAIEDFKSRFRKD